MVGSGPAGLALAGACARVGLDTGLVDPAPEKPFTATYGMWSSELPPDLPPDVVAASATGRAFALTEHDLGWEYAVLDVPALHSHLADQARGVSVQTGRVVGSPERGVVTLADGSRLRASIVVDAGGRARPLHPASTRRTPAEQTAYGVMVDKEIAAPLVAPGEALFMDWRADHGETGWPTFLYAIPLGRDAVLLEETSLARRPGLPLPTLKRRLHARLAHHGISIPEGLPTEKVWFPVDQKRHGAREVLGFGAAAPLIHPATGFSVATTLRLAPLVADAFASHLPHDPDRAVAAARHVVWPSAATVIHRFRQIGLEALLRMPPDDVPGFFERFFGLPAEHRLTYLTSRDDIRGTAVAMAHLFRASDGLLRRRLVTSAVRRPVFNDD
ncbi:lycopene cyclase family protein [Mycobacterium sp. 236(2023)]|uniref:lycopene cyclase family protein n=1 Tax=Mycobacterium sp. 236(2023) TaxID=3038163 RepID=UPI002414F757|nr:lycopene cyclase family protein [Mycobacterium sp. 236(2023)]MDG4664426.1 lycopene cyclase family protein [Mycobacterium sp. 236(2023)]